MQKYFGVWLNVAYCLTSHIRPMSYFGEKFPLYGWDIMDSNQSVAILLISE